MIFLFYILAGLLIFLSYKSFRGGIDYLNYFKSELTKPGSDFTPFASIIAPCKGLDESLKQNLEALLQQDYVEYEVIFVVDDEEDDAVGVIDNLLKRSDAETQRQEFETQKNEEIFTISNNENASSASLRIRVENSLSAKLVVAPKSMESSQKVENLREAVLHVSGDSRVFVFVDSDVRPANDWLRNLVVCVWHARHAD